ncbi:hypothetical protein [Spirilliplanes yamanashiensis]|nr:hypothetical protein [Spirilliplanes yamanashiensis]MDP9818286.1 putative phosphoribosyltransferase [Spirilliplanes yamanashiensis]
MAVTRPAAAPSEPFGAVGRYSDDFRRITDDEVAALPTVPAAGPRRRR